MAHIVCPWWLGYFLVSPVRRIWQDPHTILRPFVREGMIVLEPGCGMGFFTIELARLAGPHGRVIAVDLQPRMLSALRRRARRAGVEARVETRVASGDGLGIEDLAGKVDFALAFALVHEIPDKRSFFDQVHRALKSGGKLLVAEPKGHVDEAGFAATTLKAERAGFRVADSPAIRWSRTAVFERH